MMNKHITDQHMAELMDSLMAEIISRQLAIWQRLDKLEKKVKRERRSKK